MPSGPTRCPLRTARRDLPALQSPKVLWLLATRPAPGGVTDQVVDAVRDPGPGARHRAGSAQRRGDPGHREGPAERSRRLGSRSPTRRCPGQPVPRRTTSRRPLLEHSERRDGWCRGRRRRAGRAVVGGRAFEWSAGAWVGGGCSATDYWVLSEAARTLVRTAAVFGSEFRLEDVAALMAEPVAKLAAALDEAIQAGLLVDAGSALRFQHELLRSATLADVPPSAQRALHGAIATQLIASGPRRGRGRTACAGGRTAR